MIRSRVTRKFWFPMKLQNVLENYGLYNALLAVGMLAFICLDTFVAWRENLFLATSEDDQYTILIYFFGLIGYFMICAVVGDILYDRPHNRPALGVLDGFVISTIHAILLIFYFFYWIGMPADEWNPCHYYMPDFYWVSYHIAPTLIWWQLLLTVSCTFVFHRKRSLQAQNDYKYDV